MARDVETLPEEAPATSTESSPLLSHHQQPANESPPIQRSSCTGPCLHVVAVCISLAILSDCGETLFAAPRIRFLESIACTRYYTHHDPSLVDRNDGTVPERLCKIDPVQDKVASVMGWQLFFDSIPAILLPIPYGYLADARGRKWVLVLALAGFALSWASIIFFVGSWAWTRSEGMRLTCG